MISSESFPILQHTQGADHDQAKGKEAEGGGIRSQKLRPRQEEEENGQSEVTGASQTHQHKEGRQAQKQRHIIA